jgi:hypothetical protein
MSSDSDPLGPSGGGGTTHRAVDVDLPPPMPLHKYVENLDDWVGDKPCRLAYVGGILSGRGFGDRERSEFAQGRRGLWKIIPPITVKEVEEADLAPSDMLALGLAVVLQGGHALAVAKGADELIEVERMARYLSEQLELAGRRGTSGSIARLSSLRADLQEFRQALCAAKSGGPRVDQSFDAETGIASARLTSGHRGFGQRVWARLQQTAPGFRRLKELTTSGLIALPQSDGEREWQVDPQVPAPLGLYQYIAALDRWSSGKPAEERFLMGLLAYLEYGELEAAEFRMGRGGLWGLVPPIDAEQVAEAQLEGPAARALSVALVLFARHALARYLPEQKEGLPPELAEAAELIAVLRLSFGAAKVATDVVAGGRLVDLALDLEARGATGLTALDQRQAAIVDAHNSEVEARRVAELESFEAARRQRLKDLGVRPSGISPRRLLAAAVFLVALGVLATWWPWREDTLPPAASYAEVPAVGIIRHEDRITVRVNSSWVAGTPEEERRGSVVNLWERFGREMERPDEPVDLVLVDRRGGPIGQVKLGEVTWVTDELEPDDETPEEAPPEEAPG